MRPLVMQINLLYLGASVLIIMDMSYLARFWTQYEAWLSMQTATATGLRPVTAEHLRATIACIHTATFDFQGKQLRQIWATKTPEQAHDMLSKPDVRVTNQRDKDVQLPKIRSMNDFVVATLSEHSRAEEVHEISSLRALGIRGHRDAMSSHGPVKRLVELSVDEVGQLLHGLDLGRYSAAFKAVPVTGADLANADDSDLKEVGVEVSMHRKRLLQQVAGLSKTGVAASMLTANSNKHAAQTVKVEKAPEEKILGLHDPVLVHGNYLVAGGNCFCVLPQGPPNGERTEHGPGPTKWRSTSPPFHIPTGFRVVSRNDPDFEVVRTKIIAPYGWSAGGLIVRNRPLDDGEFSSVCSNHAKGWGPGNIHHSEANGDHLIKVLGDTLYQIVHSDRRLLLRGRQSDVS